MYATCFPATIRSRCCLRSCCKVCRRYGCRYLLNNYAKIAWKINKNVDFPGFSKSFIRLSANPHRKLRILIVIFSLQLSFFDNFFCLCICFSSVHLIFPLPHIFFIIILEFLKSLLRSCIL